MTAERDEPYALYVRWGRFRMSITGRRAILWWLGIIGALLGLRFVLQLMH